MERRILSLQPSEAAVVQAASIIYAAYIQSGKVPPGAEKDWMQQSIDEAFWLAKSADDQIQSDNEMG